VWKAPAGTEAGIAGANGLKVSFTDVEQATSTRELNVIRSSPPQASSSERAHGTADPEWTMAVRRTAILRA